MEADIPAILQSPKEDLEMKDSKNFEFQIKNEPYYLNLLNQQMIKI